MLRTFDGTEPQVAHSAYVDESAVVIGDVVIEEEASVWPNATVRGDSGQIVIRERANVQDNAVLHEDSVLEPDTTVGHSAIVHAATVGEGALVGMSAVVLDEAHVGENAVVGAGAVVTEGTEVPPATLVVGTPAEPKTEIDESLAGEAAEHYRSLARKYDETSERIE